MSRLSISDLTSNLKKRLVSFPKSKKNGKIQLNPSSLQDLCQFYREIDSFQKVIAEQVAAKENIHPATIRTIIYDLYGKLVTANGIDSVMINRCIQNAIDHIRSMGTESYIDSFYKIDDLYDLMYRLQEFGNIFSSIAIFSDS